MADTNPKPWGETTVVGKPIPRVDAYERLSGKATYSLGPDSSRTCCMRRPCVVRTPHAMVKKVDLAKALKMPGVRAVLSDADSETKIPWYSAPGGGPASRLFDPHCRFEGEEVAVVAAENLSQAWDAVRAIQVDYEKLPFVTNMEDALKPGAPAVQQGGNRSGQPRETNRGNIDQGLR